MIKEVWGLGGWGTGWRGPQRIQAAGVGAVEGEEEGEARDDVQMMGKVFCYRNPEHEKRKEVFFFLASVRNASVMSSVHLKCLSSKLGFHLSRSWTCGVGTKERSLR